MSVERPVQLGLCCMNITLKKKPVPVYAARRIIVRMIDKLGIEELKRRILQNLKDLLVMLEWNENNGIRVFRLSSEMFQHKNNPRVPDYDYDFAIPLLQQIGKYARDKGHRLTFHPGQFNNLGSPNPKVVKQTFKDLEYHADVLDIMGMGQDSVMVIHGGGVYGDKPGAINRWISNYHKLPEKVRRRLVLENCEKSYSILDCLKISWKCCDAGDYGPPVVFDTHHHACYQKLHPNETIQEPGFYIEDILETWKLRNIKPKFHVSEQGSGKIGHHSDYIDILPEYLLSIPSHYDTPIDIMIEAKAKELSIQQLYAKYPQCNCLKETSYSMCKEIMDELIHDQIIHDEIIHDVPLQNTTHDTTEQENKLDPVWHEWTETSIEIPFKEESRGIGNGERKLSKELGNTVVCGPNSIPDLKSTEYGDISVKDMTNDDCRTGIARSTEMNEDIFVAVILFHIWCDKYKDSCPIVNEINKQMNMKYGRSRTTIVEGIHSRELSETNLTKLNEIINDSINKYHNKEFSDPALTSEYIRDVVEKLGNKQLKDLLDDCVRKEGKDMKLIIVDENKGWFPVNDVSKLSCPRITSNCPRINYKW